MLKSILPTLVDLGDAVSKNLAFAYRPDTRISYGEETITETNLLTLQRKHPRYVQIKTFSKTHEATEGADWEWIFLGDTYSFKMRVQAKRVQRNGSLKIHHQSKKVAKQPQLDALLQYSAQENAMPFYCLYCADEHRKVWKPTDDRELHAGCLMADAREIKKLKQRTFADIEPISVPWHFLFSEMRHEGVDPQTYFTKFAGPQPDPVTSLPLGRFERITGGTKAGTDVPMDRNPFRTEQGLIGQLLYQSDPAGAEIGDHQGLERTAPSIIKNALRRSRWESEEEGTPIGVIIVDLRKPNSLQ